MVVPLFIQSLSKNTVLLQSAAKGNWMNTCKSLVFPICLYFLMINEFSENEVIPHAP